ncbi:MAG: hypothetical protein NE334_18860 [Lentisphaeraceae bacterium]|nr:hypothetical protein [Lentisphaeraceae bacterium]
MRYFVYFLFLLSASAQLRWDAVPQSKYSDFLVGSKIEDYSFQASAGTTSLIDSKRLTVLMPYDMDCPIAKKLVPEILRLEKSFLKGGVRFLYLKINKFDNENEVAESFKGRGFLGQLCLDEKYQLKVDLKLRTSCEVLLIDSAATLIYRGAINDQYGIGFTRDKAKKHYLKQAIEMSLKHQLPEVRLTSAPGCLLDYEKSKSTKSTGSLTFHKDVSRILQSHCENCHRKDGVAPFELISYEQVKDRRKMIKYVVKKKLMPPWFAEAGGPWLNDCGLSESDKNTLLKWIDDDCPEGDETDAPIALKWESKWLMQSPDLVIKVPQKISIPAEGRIPYKNVYVRIPLKENKWVGALEIRSKQSQVLHHVLIMDDKSGSTKLNKRKFGGGTRGFFAGLVPGQSYTEYPPETGKILRGGSWLKFQLHYTPNGKAVMDEISLAIKFLDEPPKKQIRTVSAFNARFVIPPRTKNYVVKSKFKFPVKATVLAFSPHTHLRGKSFKYELLLPNGKKQMVLDVPNYDFNWQIRYILKTPLKVPAGSQMLCTATYDNSAENPANPNPNVSVRFGDQTEDEMMIGYFEGFLGH